MSTRQRPIETLQQQLKTLRSQAEPTLRRALAEAAAIARSLRAGVRAGITAYREGRKMH